MKKISIFLFSAILSGCKESVEEGLSLNSSPALSKIENPYKLGFKDIDLPMEVESGPEKKEVGSLWRNGAQTFFKDQRASRKGDIVLVSINLNNKLNWNDSFDSKKDSKVQATLNNVIRQFNKKTSSTNPSKVLFDPANAINASTKPDFKGEGKMKHNFSLSGLKIPAIIMQVLPNGLLVVYGSREMRFSKSKERLVVLGIANQANINADNIIDFERLAESRLIRYGQGDMEGSTKVPLLTQAVNKIWPV